METERHNKHLNKRQQTQLDKKSKCCLLKKDALCSGSGPFYNGRCGKDKNEYIYQIWRNYFLAFLRYGKQKSANVKPPRIADTESQSLAADTVRRDNELIPCCYLKGRYQINIPKETKQHLYKRPEWKTWQTLKNVGLFPVICQQLILKQKTSHCFYNYSEYNLHHCLRI